MTREIDFTGRTAPWGGFDLKLELVVDIEDWIVVRHHPYAVLITGEEMQTVYNFDKSKFEMVAEERLMPFFGMLSYYDLIDELEADNE